MTLKQSQMHSVWSYFLYPHKSHYKRATISAAYIDNSDVNLSFMYIFKSET